MAKGYFIAEIAVTNAAAFRPYRDQVRATVEAYGGRFLVRGSHVEVLEGEAPPNIAIVLEFNSPDRAREWYNSPEYQAILPIRLDNSTSRVLLARGVPAL